MPRDTIICDKAIKILIMEVQKRECLWNRHYELYNDRCQMAKAWMEIAELLRLPEERLRIKWKNLRDIFKQEVKRFGGPEDYTGKWRYFEMMHFIDIAKTKGEDDDKESKNNVSNTQTKIEVNDGEYELEVEEEEPQENNAVGVYLDESYGEDPLQDKRPGLLSDEDYDLMFLKSLAPFFRQLNPIRKLVVRSRMQDMLLNEIGAQTSASQLHTKKS